ncbi:hypothetical protein BN14_01105 [Rhizoctonia solani AG-1 IB]|uniref:Uncharacterized protein n=1 Tax=Thanatephorus cucumeris (strain AG1-IB / isolate 7/3/14) TaxID=1108050 RepID=M5BK48_THACB|nr:hypothetical protein BN14_01105 [Rhizoctonia solani AG-1 IB]
MSLQSQGRFYSDTESSYGQGIAPSPSFTGSEDSVPALNLSESPSPMGRRVSLLSNASIPDSVPATPTSQSIESARVDLDSDASPRYHRIHSTPYPKPRLPLQLTPHPQARVVSLPEWTHNRDPFLEAMRNLRSVSSPARFKRPPMSPLSSDESSELSRSSQSSASAFSFPALPEQPVRSSMRSEQLSSFSIPREQFYTAPEGFFLSPPSSKSVILSPVTTGPERSLPRDRPLPPIREDDSTCSIEPNSEDEVSFMLQKATLDSSGHYSRSSVTLSSTSRSSSPESVVFLSSITGIPLSFLGSRNSSRSITEASMTQESAEDTQDASSAQAHVEYLEREHRYTVDQGQIGPNINTNGDSRAPISADNGSDWIFFDPPRPIPALHGPSSLPYARCPSGAEGVVLNDQQELDGVVWGLSERDPRSRPPDEPKHTEKLLAEQPTVPTIDPQSQAATIHDKKTQPHAMSLVPKVGSVAQCRHTHYTPNVDHYGRRTELLAKLKGKTR